MAEIVSSKKPDESDNIDDDVDIVTKTVNQAQKGRGNMTATRRKVYS